MPLFSLPSVADVRAASKMRPEQYNPKFTLEQFDAEIAGHIQSAADEVAGKILDAVGTRVWPFTAIEIAVAVPSMDAGEEAARQVRRAQDATKAVALARIWEEAGQLNDEYDEESDRLRKLADREIESLLSSITLVISSTNVVSDSTKPVAPRSRVTPLIPTF